MAQPQVAPFGSWKSPITSDLIVSETIGLGQVALDGDDIYWVEMRPAEGGRNVIVKRTPDGQTWDVSPPPFNVRTRVHEYGGGAYLVADGVVCFSDFADQRLYRQDPDGHVLPITPVGDLRYADGVFDRLRNRIICVREDHTTTHDEPVNALVGLDVTGANPAEILVSGSDFYSSPRLNFDGSALAWLSWNHPNMPWDSTELWVAPVNNEDGSLGPARRVAGGVEESILQPEWSPDGILYFVADRTGWWNLYRWRSDQVERLFPMDAEFGKPPWVFGVASYGFESAQRIICSYNQGGSWYLASLDTVTRELTVIPTAYPEMATGDLRVRPGKVVFEAGSATEPMSLLELDLSTHRIEVLRRSDAVQIDSGYLSPPVSIEFPTEDGLAAHAFFYKPQNQDFLPPPGDKPPLLVKSHGGPTGAASMALGLQIQYWTSRGFAVVDVNYGGSTGYGRSYRERLRGRWGVVDVDDCVNAALYLAQLGEVDGERAAIRGGSAGGYTALASLAFRDVFKAGASYYGVSDLEALARDTHKFESRYLDGLVGPYPQRRDIYQERSPIHFTQQFSCPLILFQGLEDRIVPPSQAELMFDAVRQKGLPTAYLPFEGEQHGFRQAQNIKRSLDAELYFYSRVFGFELADPVEPITIENLQAGV